MVFEKYGIDRHLCGRANICDLLGCGVAHKTRPFEVVLHVCAFTTWPPQNYMCFEAIGGISCKFRSCATQIVVETSVFYSVSCNWTPRWYFCVVHQMFATPRNRTRSITTNCGTRVSPDAVFPMAFGDLGNWEHLLNPRCSAGCLSCEALSVNVVTPLPPGVHLPPPFAPPLLHLLLHHWGGETGLADQI